MSIVVNPATGLPITPDQIDWHMRHGQPDLRSALVQAACDINAEGHVIIAGWRIWDLLCEAAAHVPAGPNYSQPTEAEVVHAERLKSAKEGV